MKTCFIYICLLFAFYTADAQGSCRALPQLQKDGFKGKIKTITETMDNVDKVGNNWQPAPGQFTTITCYVYDMAGNLKYRNYRVINPDIDLNTTTQYQTGSKVNFSVPDSIGEIQQAEWMNDTTVVIHRYTKSYMGDFSLTEVIQDVYNTDCVRMYRETTSFDIERKEWEPKKIEFDNRKAGKEELEMWQKYRGLAKYYIDKDITIHATDKYGNPTLLTEQSIDQHTFRISYEYTYY